ncbi:MAG: L-serine ammonia-lyase, iron-sulfur-dependent, subunit alpha [Bacillota bacterium]
MDTDATFATVMGDEAPSVADLIEEASGVGRLSGVALEGPEGEALLGEMQRRWRVMRESVEDGLEGVEESAGGMVARDGRRYLEYVRSGEGLLSTLPGKAAAYALAASECNACMGRVCAAPTAGACGVLPGIFLAISEERGFSDAEIAAALVTAGLVGSVIAARASLSGAEGGCQAECGSAAAMGAAALVELEGGTPDEAGHAAALALKGFMGLVCDPVAGLVEVPCIKRNAMAAVHALTAADMALAGVASAIPVDEVIDAMGRVGRALPEELRETGRGGVAATPTGRAISARIHGDPE